jgi:hypothetical protein
MHVDEIESNVYSVFVEDQEKAFVFCTQKLRFVKEKDISRGSARGMTVVSPEDPEGAELLLEPNSHPAARTYQEAIFKDGIPATGFQVEEIQVSMRNYR